MNHPSGTPRHPAPDLLIAYWYEKWAFGKPGPLAPFDVTAETLDVLTQDDGAAHDIAIGFGRSLDLPQIINGERTLADWIRLMDASRPMARASFETGAGARLIRFGRTHPTPFVLHSVFACLDVMHDRLMGQAPIKTTNDDAYTQQIENMRDLLTMGSAAQDPEIRIAALNSFEGLFALLASDTFPGNEKITDPLLAWTKEEEDPEVRENLYDKISFVCTRIAPQNPKNIVRCLKPLIKFEQDQDEPMATLHALSAFMAAVRRCRPDNRVGEDAAFLAECLKHECDPAVLTALGEYLNALCTEDPHAASNNALSLTLDAALVETDEDQRISHLETMGTMLRVNARVGFARLGEKMAALAEDKDVSLMGRLKGIENIALLLNNNPGHMRGGILRPLRRLARQEGDDVTACSLRHSARHTLEIYRMRNSGQAAHPASPDMIVFMPCVPPRTQDRSNATTGHLRLLTAAHGL